MQDISASGVRCLTDRPLALMTQVQLVLVIPSRSNGAGGNREIVCRGAVVRSHPITEVSKGAEEGRSQPAGGSTVAKAATKTSAAKAAATKTSERRETNGGQSAGGPSSSARFDTAIFFTDMKDTDRSDVEEFVSRSLRSTR